MRKSGYEAESQPERSGVGSWKPRWKMVFTWQCPMMFMSYSVCLFLLGLTMFVCTPLIRGDDWGPASNVSACAPCSRIASILLSVRKIAVIYLGVAAVAVAVFIFCGFWVYHYVDLEHEADSITETEPEIPMTNSGLALGGSHMPRRKGERQSDEL